MYPKVVRARGFLYFQVRRAASSAIQNVLGTDFIDWRVALAQPDIFRRFTVYRNTFDKLRSLYHNFVAAPQERQSFGLELPPTPRFEDFILAVCDTDDKTCDEHLVSQNWHHFIPSIDVYLSVEAMSRATSLRIPFFGRKTPKLNYIYTQPMLRAMQRRYGPELEEYNYLP